MVVYDPAGDGGLSPLDLSEAVRDFPGMAVAIREHRKDRRPPPQVLLDRCASTEKTREWVTYLEGEVERVKGSRAKTRQKQKMLERARTDLEYCLMRDEIQDERRKLWPECFCLGVGGKHVVGISVEVDGRIRGPVRPDDVPELEWNPPTTYTSYCSCPQGQAAKDAADGVRDETRDYWQAEDARRLKMDARIPDEYAEHTWRGYVDAVARNGGDRDQVERKVSRLVRWIHGEREPDRPWLILWGPASTGKTSLANLMVREWMEAGKGAIFSTVSDLLDALRATYGRNESPTTSEVQRAFREVPLLVLDDLGGESTTESNAQWLLDELFKLLNARYNDNRVTIFTTNLDPRGVLEFYGERIHQRIIRMARRLPIDGPNLRESTVVRIQPGEEVLHDVEW